MCPIVCQREQISCALRVDWTSASSVFLIYLKSVTDAVTVGTTLLQRDTETGSHWQMWQQNANANATSRVESGVPTDVGQVATTL